MGERHGAGGLPGHRRTHPNADDLSEMAGFEAWFGAALRADGVDSGGEHRAVAAFRAARDAGVRRPRTRRRDDWRPAAPRRARLSLRTTLSVALAGLTLGGVAVAAIGTVHSGAEHPRDAVRSARPSASAPHRPAAGAPSAGTGVPAPTDPAVRPHHPATARDTLAHCRAYERAGDRGGALGSTAWQRLVAAAGGPEKVTAYCVQVERTQEKKSGKSGNSGNDSGRAAASSKSADEKKKKKK